MKGEINVLENMLSVKTGKREHELHNKIIAAIVRGLYNEGFKEINYDHIKIEIEKKNLPLQLGKRRYDIVVKIAKNEYAFIEITHIKSWQQHEREY